MCLIVQLSVKYKVEGRRKEKCPEHENHLFCSRPCVSLKPEP